MWWFKVIRLLKRNPQVPCTEPYLSIISRPMMRPLTVQVTCAFWDDDIRLFYEPNAPSVHSRLHALKFLAESGIDVELRIEPLFPSSRVPETIRIHKPLSHHSIPEAQSRGDIGNLVRFAKKSKVRAVIAKPLKFPFSKNAQRCKEWFATIYRDAYPEKKEGRQEEAGGYLIIIRGPWFQRYLISVPERG